METPVPASDGNRRKILGAVLLTASALSVATTKALSMSKVSNVFAHAWGDESSLDKSSLVTDQEGHCAVASDVRTVPIPKARRRPDHALGRPYTFPSNATCPWAGQVARAAVIHVGKAAGVVVSLWLQSVGVVHDTFHVRSAHMALSCRYTHYVVATRDPLARTISAFNFRHVLGGVQPGTETSLTEHELYVDCFPELPGGVNKFAESLDGTDRCARLARACLYEPARECVHMGRGHAYYLQSTGLMEVLRRPDKQLFVMRTEHLEEDGARLFDWLCVPAWQRGPMPDDPHGGDPRRKADTTLSARGESNLRAHLTLEYHVYNEVLQLAEEKQQLAEDQNVSGAIGAALDSTLDNQSRAGLSDGARAFSCYSACVADDDDASFEPSSPLSSHAANVRGAEEAVPDGTTGPPAHAAAAAAAPASAVPSGAPAAAAVSAAEEKSVASATDSSELEGGICSWRKLLVVSVPETAPACIRSPLTADRRKLWPAACSTDDQPLQAVPCSAHLHGDACTAYAAQHASSWFTPSVYRLPGYEDDLPLQRTWLIVRLTAEDALGNAAEPCVTFDAADPDIEAVALFHPPADITATETNSLPSECANLTTTERWRALAAVNETIAAFERAAEHVPMRRRFVFGHSRQKHLQPYFFDIVDPLLAVTYEGLDAFDPRLADTIRRTNATFVNRGGGLLTSSSARPNAEPDARELLRSMWEAEPHKLADFFINGRHTNVQYNASVTPHLLFGGVTEKLVMSELGNYMGWSMNIDSAWTPVDAHELASWQNVLSQMAALPGDLGDLKAAMAEAAIMSNITSGNKAAAAQQMMAAAFSARQTLITSNAGAHGLSACLRHKLHAACDSLPSTLCAGNMTADFWPHRFAVTGNGTSPSGSDPSCGGELDFYELWASATFCLMPGGDAFDRGATVQALDVGCIPVFFSGTGEGDLLRQAFSRSFFGTASPDDWSVLLDEEALLMCTGSADDERCDASCVTDREMAQRLLQALSAELDTAAERRAYIIDTLPRRSQALTATPNDFVQRFVEATTTARPPSTSGAQGNVAGQVTSWPVHQDGFQRSLRATKPVSGDWTASKPPCQPRSDGNGCLPGFLVIGPQKTGTSSLYHYMGAHPQMQLSATKELLHWGGDPDDVTVVGPNNGHFDCSAPFVDSYLDRFERVSVESGNATGDFTATDVAHISLGCNLSCLHGNLSKYVHAKLPPLGDCIYYAPTLRERALCAQGDMMFGWSLYGDMVDHWLTLYPLEQLMMVSSEALLNEPLVVLRAIEEHLSLQRGHYPPSLLSTDFNSDQGYGWHVPAGGAPSNATMEKPIDCGEACEAAAALSHDEQACISYFFRRAARNYSHASRFLWSNASTCIGAACSRAPLIPTDDAVLLNQVGTCLASTKRGAPPAQVALDDGPGEPEDEPEDEHQLQEPPEQPEQGLLSVAATSLSGGSRRVVAWVHLPKCGSTFLNTLAHWLDVDSNLPANASVGISSVDASPDAHPVNDFAVHYPPYLWAAPDRFASDYTFVINGSEAHCWPEVGHPNTIRYEPVAPDSLAARASASCMNSGHRRVTPAAYGEWTGEYAAMFRHPSSRSKSMYAHTSRQEGAACTQHAGFAPMSLSEYEAAQKGLMVKMIAGQEDGECGFDVCKSVNGSADRIGTTYAGTTHACGDYGSITPDVSTAIARLDGFKFVGLLEEWANSICLFHAKFGGTCRAAEFTNTHAGDDDSGDDDAGDDVDEYDLALYTAVEKRFRREMRAYGIGKQVCTAICPGLAAHFNDQGRFNVSFNDSTSTASASIAASAAMPPPPSHAEVALPSHVEVALPSHSQSHDSATRALLYGANGSKPVAAWLHLPKTGTTFMNTVAHWLDVDGWLPPYAAVPNCKPPEEGAPLADDACGHLGLDFQKLLQTFSVMYPPYYWAGPDRLAASMVDLGTHLNKSHCTQEGVWTEDRVRFKPVAPNSTEAYESSECASRGHMPLTKEAHEAWHGSWMTMVRDASTRHFSHYSHVTTSSMRMQHFPNATASCQDQYGIPWVRAMTAVEYATAHAGLMVKEVAGQQSGGCGFYDICVLDTTLTPGASNATLASVELPLEKSKCHRNETPNLSLAVERLATFNFVGLTEEWTLSVCLFHAINGGECFAVEDSNTRSGGESSDPAVLAAIGEADPWDTALYEFASVRFHNDVARYQLTPAKCKAICPALADRFDDYLFPS